MPCSTWSLFCVCSRPVGAKASVMLRSDAAQAYIRCMSLETRALQVAGQGRSTGVQECAGNFGSKRNCLQPLRIVACAKGLVAMR